MILESIAAFPCRVFDSRQRDGFTLTELIVALAVLSSAVAGLVAMFGAALHLAHDAQDRVVAAEIAAAQLHLICAAPGLFLWQKEKADASSLFPILASADQPRAGVPVKSPEIRMATRAAQERTDTRYSRFRWEAWGRRHSSDANTYEVTLSVHWQSRGRLQTLALTTAIPAFLAERNTTLAAAVRGEAP